MSDPKETSWAEMEAESEHMTGGPGVVATKSQAQGAVGGGLVGAVIGGLVGLAIGQIAFDGESTIITIVVGVVAGLVFGGVSGGIVLPMIKHDRGDPDI